MDRLKVLAALAMVVIIIETAIIAYPLITSKSQENQLRAVG